MTAPTEPGWLLLAGIFVFGWVATAFASRRGVLWLLVPAALIAAAATGAVAAKTRTFATAAPVLSERLGPVRVEGVVAEIDASDSGRRVRLAVRAIEGVAAERTPRFVRFTHRGEAPWRPGQALSCRVILSPPPRPTVPGDYAFHRDAWFQQLGGVGFALGPCAALTAPPPQSDIDRATAWLAATRRAMAEHVAAAGGEGGGALAAAMTVGDRSFISAEDNEALRASGLAHLISISGLHMVLAGGAFFFAVRMVWPLIEPLALRVPSVKAAAALAIAGCTGYLFLSGFEVPTQRAYVIALVGFGAKLFDRPALSLRSLAIALGAIVLLQPESVVSPGFQMSFAASAALVALYEIWPRIDRPLPLGAFSRIVGWFIAAVATSVVASLATLPFAIHHFSRLAPLSIIANVMASPVITFWTTPAALGAAAAAPLGLSEPFLWLMARSLDLVLRIAHDAAARSPEIAVPGLEATAMLASAMALIVFCVLRGAARLIALAPAAMAAAIWLQAAPAGAFVASDGTVFVRDEGTWLEITRWRETNGLNPLVIRNPPKRACGSRKGEIQQPCVVEAEQATFTIDAALGPGAEAGGCKSRERMQIAPREGGAMVIDPCALARQGGAVVEIGRSHARVRTAQPSDRPWAPRPL